MVGRWSDGRMVGRWSDGRTMVRRWSDGRMIRCSEDGRMVGQWSDDGRTMVGWSDGRTVGRSDDRTRYEVWGTRYEVQGLVPGPPFPPLQCHLNAAPEWARKSPEAFRRPAPEGSLARFSFFRLNSYNVPRASYCQEHVFIGNSITEGSWHNAFLVPHQCFGNDGAYLHSAVLLDFRKMCWHSNASLFF